MKHAFSFSKSAHDALKAHIRLALANIEPTKYFQEPWIFLDQGNQLQKS